MKDKELKEALYALGCMWNQYCGKSGHLFMSAGESASEVLMQHGLLHDDYSEIDYDKLDALMLAEPLEPTAGEKCIQCPHDLFASYKDLIQCDCPCHSKAPTEEITEEELDKSIELILKEDTPKLPDRIKDNEVATEYVVRHTLNAIVDYLKSKE